MAVYTEIDDDALLEFCATYDLGDVLSCKGIAEGVENSNFLLTLTTGPYILTLYEKRVNPDDLPFFLGLMDHLSEAGIPCPRPMRARDGKTLQELAGRPSVIVTFLGGVSLKQINEFHCTELGYALGKLHMAGTDFELSRTNRLAVGSWRDLLESCGTEVNDLQPGFYKQLEAEIMSLQRGWPDDLPSGVIHADLFPDNVLFRGEYLSGLIDFYFACNDSFAYDLAVCLNAWCFEADNRFNPGKARRMLDGYCKVRELSENELKALPVLARGAAMRFLLTRLYDWINTPKDALVVVKDPMEYWGKVQFHKAVKSPQEYGWKY